MNFFKNASAITFYFMSMLCFLAGYLVKTSQPYIYLIAMILGIALLVIGFMRRTNK